METATIYALGTPLPSRAHPGAVSVIRLSGPRATEALIFLTERKAFERGYSARDPALPEPRRMVLRSVFDPHSGEVLDRGLAVWFEAPNSETGEMMAELHLHGGRAVVNGVLEAIGKLGFCRLAEPGEFTRRAFLNGRIDLAQAEAVADLIHSRTELALAAANEQLAGKLSQRINQLRDDLLHTLAHVEAHIDFPEEDIAPDTKEQLLKRLEEGVGFIGELLRTANEGQILRRGIRAAILGRPNAGKSSLLNQLLGRDRAIVSPIAGTTRDTIEETANIRGLPVIFIDTAGLREGRDEIEVEGIRRSRETLERAELILHVLDASEPLTGADENYLAEFSGKKRIFVLNKIDLPKKLELPELVTRLSPLVTVSCLSGQGMEALKDAIKNLVWAGKIEAGMLQVMINSRHQEALGRAHAATVRTLDALRADATLELVALDLRIAVNAVGEIVGKTATEDLLDSIFSQFCIGK
jgi:tRNA modification GTPase